MADKLKPPESDPDRPSDFHREDPYESLGGGIRTFREHGRIPSIDQPFPTNSESTTSETGEQPATSDPSASAVPEGKDPIGEIRRNLEEMGERL